MFVGTFFHQELVLPLPQLTPSSQRPSAINVPDFIVNPLLAFLKGYHLRGDISSLKRLVASHFDFP